MTQTPLVGTRAGRAEHTPQDALVLVETTDDEVHFILDDGEVLTLDRRELLAAAQVAA